jgi:AcrR family transcriptional regulator
MGRPRGSSGEATRARILDAARACFARTGFETTTNREIADHAGLTAAALYQYYDSKLALYMATVQHAQRALAPRYAAVVARTSSLRAALRALLVESVAIAEQDPSLTAFLSALPVEMSRHPEIASAMAGEPSEVVGVFVEALERGVRGKELAPGVRPEHLLSMFIACSMGLSLYAAAVDPTELGGAAGTFAALIEGKVFTVPKRATAKKPRSRARG